MDIRLVLVLALMAALLGACPFSIWIGHWFLKKNIREFGDGNPGAWNVFRAGGRVTGWLALILDVGKGFPVVALAGSHFGLPDTALYVIGLSAVLGHAFSPFLRFKGGKSVAVTYGVMLALPQREILVLMAVFMLLGFFFFAVNAWATAVGPLGSIAFLAITGSPGIQFFFLLSVLLVFVVKSYSELKRYPGHKGLVFQWLQAIRR